ncbi:MAG: T9SS type A sorting domain-containing protein [Flavobacteriales bacterium]|nr:T9SS type A sorting domain-containing protein [Flavobacteriales bacterium]
MKNILILGVLIASAIAQISAQTITTESGWKNDFNSYPNSLRVVMTNDPSCPGCLEMVSNQIAIYENVHGCGLNSSIQYFFNWTKVFTTTTYSDAQIREGQFQDPTLQGRYHHYYDSTQVISDKIQDMLGLVDPSGAGGVYTGWHTLLFYEPGITWGNTINPPFPTFWMHKLDTIYNADPLLYYDSATVALNFNIIACAATSVDETSAFDKFSIFPIPSDGKNLKISINVNGRNNRLVIVDIMDRIIFDEKINSATTFDLPAKLNSGTYIVSFIEGNHTITSRKIVITE